MLEKIILANEKGETRESSIVAVFDLQDKKFIITTDNELDPSGHTVLHVSEISKDQLIPVSDDNMWKSVKDTMRAIIAGDNSIKYEPVVAQASTNGVYSSDISVEKNAFDVMATNYNKNKPVAEPMLNMPDMQNFDVAPNPFENGVPANEVQMQSSVVEIAPGISEVTQVPVNPMNNVVDFQQVPNVGNPVDLIDNNVVDQGSFQNNVVSFPDGNGVMPNQMAMPVQDINPSMVAQPPVDMNNGVEKNVAQVETTQTRDFIQEMINSTMKLINPNAVSEENVDIIAEFMSGVIRNFLHLGYQGIIQEVQKEKDEVARERAQVEIMKQGVEAKLAMSNAMNGMQQQSMNNMGMMNNGMMQPMQQPMMDPMMQQQMMMNQQYQMNGMQNNMMYQQPMNNMGMMNGGMMQPMQQPMMDPMMQQQMPNMGQMQNPQEMIMNRVA